MHQRIHGVKLHDLLPHGWWRRHVLERALAVRRRPQRVEEARGRLESAVEIDRGDQSLKAVGEDRVLPGTRTFAGRSTSDTTKSAALIWAKVLRSARKAGRCSGMRVTKPGGRVLVIAYGFPAELECALAPAG